MKRKIIGYHVESTLPIKQGDKVRIKEGVELWTTHPKKKGWYRNGRTRTITVHHLLPGMNIPKYDLERYSSYMEHAERALGQDILIEKLDSSKGHEMIPVQNPRVVWAGTGGYWVECDINDVEKVE